MSQRQNAFFEFVIGCGVLRFGEFTLKSGRRSPYFFNAGLFNSGERVARLGEFYAQAIEDAGISFDMLFGPAYKGIPLAVATAIAFHRRGRDVPFAFNRKEPKDHGEGGQLVGSALSGRVLIIDDVISAGTSVRESVHIIRAANAALAGVAIALDREERGSDSLSATQEVQQQYAMPVISIASLSGLLEFLSDNASVSAHRAAVQRYRDTYGANAR